MISRRILAAVALLCLIAPAHAQKTKATLNTEINVNFPDNMAGFITPALARPTLQDIINSIMPTAPVISGNLACFNGTTGLLQDCGVSPTAAGLTVAISAISGGTTTRVLFDNAGVLGEYAISGSGSVCMSTSCVMTTPALGTPSAAVLTNGTGLPTTGLTGTLQAAQEPAHTGDCTNSAGSLALNCLSTNGTAFTATATATTGQLPATATNDNAASGKVGEYIESVIVLGSATGLVTNTAKTVTSISLTAGDWDIAGNVAFSLASTTSISSAQGSISLTTNVADLTNGRSATTSMAAFVPTAGTDFVLPIQPVRFSVGTTTSVFLVALSTFTANTNSAYGIIRARRVR